MIVMAKKIIFFDTETTGLKIGQDRIIEIAAYNPLDQSSFSRLINPQIPISEETKTLCQISDEMVKDEPTFDTVIKDFIAFCPEETVLVAHNGDSFDKPFLEAECKRCNILLPPYLYFDTLKWARKYRPDLPKHSLQYLREAYQIPPNQAHRALNDVMILYQVYSKMTDDLSIEQVFTLLKEKNTDLDRMPFGKYQGQDLKQIPKSYYAWLKKNNVLEKEENKKLKEALDKLHLLEGIEV
jgi:DNA polymerase-3 subunit epsilon